MAGYVKQLTQQMTLNGSNTFLYSEDVPSISTTYGTTPSVSDSGFEVATQGFFGKFNYAYDDKYLLEVTGRYDGTSRFLEDVRWKAYPGVSVGWNVNKEAFWTEGIAKVVNSLKFRASYGQLGDHSAISGNYPFYPSLGTTAANSSNWFFGNGNRLPYVTAPGLVDPTLTWVTSTTKNLGIDLGFLNNRLTANFDIFTRFMDDYVGPAEELPAVLGTNAPQTNATSLETDGWEFTVEWRDKIGQFNYSARGVLSDYVGTVVKYPNEAGLLSTWYEGQNMGDIWGYVTDRYFVEGEDLTNVTQFGQKGLTPGDIKYVDLNGDGKIDAGAATLADPGDRKVIGNSTPRYSYSLFTEGSYKGFDFSLFLQGVGQRDFYTAHNMYMGVTEATARTSVFTEHLDRWTPETPNGFFPKAYFNATRMSNQLQTQTKYLMDAAYLRIKNLQIGYTLPIAEKLKIQKFRVYMSVDNLFTYSKMQKHSSIDPENLLGTGAIYPLQRTYSFGTNISL